VERELIALVGQDGYDRVAAVLVLAFVEVDHLADQLLAGVRHPGLGEAIETVC